MQTKEEEEEEEQIRFFFSLLLYAGKGGFFFLKKKKENILFPYHLEWREERRFCYIKSWVVGLFSVKREGGGQEWQ